MIKRASFSVFKNLAPDDLGPDAPIKFTLYRFTKGGGGATVYSNNPAMVTAGAAVPWTESIRRKVVTEDTVVIGNGGAGAAGFIKHLANEYAKENRGHPVNVVWRASHSWQNFDNMDTIDAAITYEPHDEKRLAADGRIENLRHLFLNHFEIAAAPKDVFDVAKLKGADARDIMEHIITEALLADTRGGGRFRIYYLSRYNHSAMGERDQYLFYRSIKSIAHDIRKRVPRLRPIAEFLHLTEPHLTPHDQERLLYAAWIKHVKKEVTKFPWEMIGDLKRSGTAAGPIHQAYHLNDRTFFYRDDYHHKLVTRTTDEASDPLLNPAQLWTPAKRRRDANATRFLRWVLANRVRLVDGWFPPGLATKMKAAGHDSLYTAKPEHNFDWVHGEHVKMIRELQKNDHLANDWYWHRPSQRKRPHY